MPTSAARIPAVICAAVGLRGTFGCSGAYKVILWRAGWGLGLAYWAG